MVNITFGQIDFKSGLYVFPDVRQSPLENVRRFGHVPGHDVREPGQSHQLLRVHGSVASAEQRINRGVHRSVHFQVGLFERQVHETVARRLFQHVA